jgi:hypothetical protein
MIYAPKILLSSLFIFLTTTIFAQNQDSIPTPLQFRHEIGIGWATMLQSSRDGVGLMFKTPLGKIKPGTWKKQTILRFSAAFARRHEAFSYNYTPLDSIMHIRGGVGKGNEYEVSAGYERRLTRKRSQFYYGIIATYNRSKLNYDDYDVTKKSGVLLYETTSRRSVETSLSAVSILAGYCYYLHPRLSIGLEVSFDQGIYRSKQYVNGSLLYPTTWRDNVYEVKILTPRLVYLSYHFG